MDAIEQQIAAASMINGGAEPEAIDPSKDSGLHALVVIAKAFDISVDPMQVWHVHGKTDSTYHYRDIVRCAQRIGLKASITTLSLERIETAPLPLLITYKETGTRYVIRTVSDNNIEMINPLTGRVSIRSINYLR